MYINAGDAGTMKGDILTPGLGFVRTLDWTLLCTHVVTANKTRWKNHGLTTEKYISDISVQIYRSVDFSSIADIRDRNQ